MEAGVDVLIEKPMTATLEEADELIRLASTHKRVVQVGHLERFNPAVRATLPLINRPMFFEVHRLGIFSPRSLDVDVVLDNVGGETIDRSLTVLKDSGHIISYPGGGSTVTKDKAAAAGKTGH